MEQGVLNQVVLIGRTDGNPSLRLDIRPFLLAFTLHIPPAPNETGEGIFVKVLKRGNDAIDSKPERDGDVMVVGSLQSSIVALSEEEEKGVPRAWIQALSVRTPPVAGPYNSAVVLGKITSDVQLRQDAAGRPWASFLLAVPMPSWARNRVSLIKVSVRGQSAVSRYVPEIEKGRFCLCRGKIASRIMQGGRSDVSVIAQEIIF
ncbi:MAG: single-stranded DNA-binding protein [Thermoproteota archaeon]